MCIWPGFQGKQQVLIEKSYRLSHKKHIDYIFFPFESQYEHRKANTRTCTHTHPTAKMEAESVDHEINEVTIYVSLLTDTSSASTYVMSSEDPNLAR